MAQFTRAQAREILFGLVFETDFRGGDNASQIFDIAVEDREIPDDKYIREAFFGITGKRGLLDSIIEKYSNGWKIERLSAVSRSILRIAIYEILCIDNIPANVSVAQAVELSLKFGEDKAMQFVNGLLSSVVKDYEISAEKVLEGCLTQPDAEDAEKKAENDEP